MNRFVCLFTETLPTVFYTLSLHDALPISERHGKQEYRGAPSDELFRAFFVDREPRHHQQVRNRDFTNKACKEAKKHRRSEEHTSELQSRFDLVCRLPPEKKKKEI